MTTCLVLGGADCLHADLDAYTGPIDGVVACNDAGAEWAGDLDGWVSLHPRYFQIKSWRQARADKGYPPARRHFGHMDAQKIKDGAGLTCDVKFTEYRFPGQDKSGSSGLFAAKVALIDLGFDRVVFCGVPMTEAPHFWDVDRAPWKVADGFRRQWLTVPEEYRARMRSMSGWSRVLLGPPETTGETA